MHYEMHCNSHHNKMVNVVWSFRFGVERQAKNPQKKVSELDQSWEITEIDNGLHLETWKIRTLNKPRTLKYALEAKNNDKLDVLALQEIRWPNNGNISKENITLFNSGRKNEKYAINWFYGTR